MAADELWFVHHIDLNTAFLQGEEYDLQRDVVCQLPPEAEACGWTSAARQVQFTCVHTHTQPREHSTHDTPAGAKGEDSHGTDVAQGSMFWTNGGFWTYSHRALSIRLPFQTMQFSH